MKRNPDPHGAILRAAKWAEEHHKPGGRHVPTWTVLYEIAGRVASGDIDVSDMPELDTPWSGMLIYLETKGIDVNAEAHRLAGSSPMFKVS